MKQQTGSDMGHSNRRKKELLFFDAYEQFYKMAAESPAFQNFCRDAYGEDFSQDGFSDIDQINRIIPYIPKEGAHILDIGCGNGKMLGYLQRKTGAWIHGVDYSDTAIAEARKSFQTHSDFQVGVIGETEYPGESFDVVISMDSMYFAKDMVQFVGQIKSWIKPGGVFFVGYQEGDVMAKTENAETTVFSDAMRKNHWSYEVSDITRECFDVLKKKRETAILHKDAFEKEGGKMWYDLLLMQTDAVNQGQEAFSKKLARYLYVARR